MKIQPSLLFAPFAALTLLLSGCGKPATPPAAESTPASPAAAASPASSAGAAQTDSEKRLNIFCWSEYVPQDVIEAFTKETGIKVYVENYASNEEMLAKLFAGGGNYDLIQPSEYVIEALIKANALRPIDHALLPNLKNIDPKFLNMPFDPGNKFTVPWMAGSVGIVVNTEKITDPINGYTDVFQEKFKGRIVTLDDARELVSWGFNVLKIPTNDVTDENLQKVKPLLAGWIPLIKVFDSDSPKTALINGDVDLGIVWNGEGAILYNTDKKFKWVIPAEGTHLFVDSLAIPKGSTHPLNAQLFMNFIMRPEINKMVADAFPYLNPNAAGRALMSAEQLANPASFPTDADMARMEIFNDIGDKASNVDELVTSLKVQ